MAQQGRWYLLYEDVKAREGLALDLYDRYTKRIELIANSEEAAVPEGRAKWEEKVSRGTYRGGRWGSEIYPNSPRVVYEVTL